MENEQLDMPEIAKKPVMGAIAPVSRAALALCIVLCTAIFVVLAVKQPEHRSVFLTVMAAGDVVLLLLAYIVPAAVFCSRWTYSLDESGITLYKRGERAVFMPWDETDVSLGSFISRGSERSPGVCRKAICFTQRGHMRRPQRFPKRALRGAGGEMCISFSKSRLRDVFTACGGRIMSDITADGCRISDGDAETMQLALAKLISRAEKAVASRAEAQRANSEAAQAAEAAAAIERARREAEDTSSAGK